MRPVLRPGAVLLRRDATHLQVGLEPGRAVVVADSERLRRTVGALDGVRDLDAVVDAVSAAGVPDPTATRHTIEALGTAGLVTDAAVIRSAPAPAEMAHRLARGERSASATARSRRRADATVLVHGTGPLAAHVGRLLAGSGVSIRPAAESGHETHGTALRQPPAADGADSANSADVVVLVGQLAGTPSSDRLVSAGIPHLAVAVVDGTAVLGPFVLPGRTGCLRCVDAARAAVDPAWPVLVAQLGDRREVRPYGVPAPRSLVLESALAAWSAREVLAHLSGEPAVTYGASLRFDDYLVEQVRHRWCLHPACGCALLI